MEIIIQPTEQAAVKLTARCQMSEKEFLRRQRYKRNRKRVSKVS